LSNPGGSTGAPVIVGPPTGGNQPGGNQPPGTGGNGNQPGGNNPNIPDYNGGENFTPSGEAYNPTLTAYSPQRGGALIGMEGGYASSITGLDGRAVVRTLDDYAAGRSSYVTLAGDSSQYRKSYVIPTITYKNSSGQLVTLTNVKGYVHDTGSAFRGAGDSKFDVPVGRDYGNYIMNTQPFNGNSVQFIPSTINNGN
jgi:hypothetical protein